MKEVSKYLIPLVIGILIGILINISSCNKPEPIVQYIEKHDTVTVEKERIVEKTKIKYINRIDTFYIYKGDTVYLQDLPIECKQYTDTIKTDSTSTEISIDYSGFNASIDNIWLKHNYFNKQEVIVKEPKRVGIIWFVGVSAGYGMHGNINTGTFGHGPSIQIGAGIGIGGEIKTKNKIKDEKFITDSIIFNNTTSL